jgi:hypothetical protein
MTKLLQKRLLYIGEISLTINIINFEQKTNPHQEQDCTSVESLKFGTEQSHDRLKGLGHKQDLMQDEMSYDSLDMRCCSNPHQLLGFQTRQKPFLWLLEHYSRDFGYALKSFGHNILLMDLVGLSEISLHGVGQGFEILTYLRSENWVKYYTQILKFKVSDKRTECKLDLDS